MGPKDTQRVMTPREQFNRVDHDSNPSQNPSCLGTVIGPSAPKWGSAPQKIVLRRGRVKPPPLQKIIFSPDYAKIKKKFCTFCLGFRALKLSDFESFRALKLSKRATEPVCSNLK